MSIYDSLNNEQKQAVMHTEGPVLILAGAGSGKTRVLVHRIAYMIEEKGIAPYNILAITFTNKAAGEMRERVDNLVGFGSEQIWVATFHSTCVRILRRHIDLLGFDTNFTIYDSDDSKSVMKQVFKNLNIDNKQLKEKRVLNAISSAKDELIGPEQFERDAFGYDEQRIATCYKEYQEVLRSSNALDFDDIIFKTVELFKTHPEVLDNYSERFRYIMVDEYQDTNIAQYELIRLLAKKYRNLCVVGDDDQSIYKFRGANIRNILDFEQHFEEAFVIKLEQNYRSTQNILDAANAVIRNNVGRKEKALWTSQGEGDKLHFRQFDTAYEEAEYIADDLEREVRKAHVRFKECAVLYRTNAQSRILEEKFVRDGIPYNLVGGVNFYDRKEIKDMLAYLRMVDNARDDLQVKRIINVPRRGIGQTTIDRITTYAREHALTFYEACEEVRDIPSIGAAAKKIEGFVDMVRVMRASAPEYGLRGLINDIIERTGYIAELQASEEEDAEDRIDNIYELVNKIVYYEDTTDEPSLSGFLEEVALVSDLDDMDEQEDRAVLMTIHAAKGLEFERVYIAGCEDGVFPSYMSMMDTDPDAIEEERRLAYVGITRAKKDLTITYARCRMNKGEFQYNPVSRFVREIPEHLLDNTLPKQKKVELDSYDNDSYERNIFKAKPFGLGNGSTAGNVFGVGSGISSGNVFGAGSGISKGFGSLATGSTSASKAGSKNGKPSSTLNAMSAFSKGMAKADKLEYGVGDRVSHVKYGQGTVLDILDDVKDYKVTVEFDGAGKKVMYAMFAKLKKI